MGFILKNKNDLADVLRHMTWGELEDSAVEIIGVIIDMRSTHGPVDEIRLSHKHYSDVAAALNYWAKEQLGED